MTTCVCICVYLCVRVCKLTNTYIYRVILLTVKTPYIKKNIRNFKNIFFYTI